MQRLAQVNAEVIALNIPKLFSEGLADPGAFGLDGNQDLTGTCFSVSSDCTENLKYGINSATPDPTKLLFNDGVHPTITGQPNNFFFLLSKYIIIFLGCDNMLEKIFKKNTTLGYP